MVGVAVYGKTYVLEPHEGGTARKPQKVNGILIILIATTIEKTGVEILDSGPWSSHRPSAAQSGRARWGALVRSGALWGAARRSGAH